MTEDLRETKDGTSPLPRRGPIVAGTEAHEDEKPVENKEGVAPTPQQDRRGPIVAGPEAREDEKATGEKSEDGPS